MTSVGAECLGLRYRTNLSNLFSDFFLPLKPSTTLIPPSAATCHATITISAVTVRSQPQWHEIAANEAHAAFNHGPSADSEREYDRLRDLARKEQGQHQHYAAEARKAYEKGDGAGAHEFSQQSKAHEAKADDYNRQASEYIFRENNAVGKVAGDTIDLHGQFVEEAEEILEQRIRYAQSTGQSHLHVIVGKGNHSANHVQKIKPRVEQVCRELGLQYNTEQNEGRIYVNLQPGGGGQHPPDEQKIAYPMGNRPQYSYANAAGGYPGAQHHQQQQMQYGQQQHQQHRPPQQQMQYEEPQEKKESKCCGLCIVM